MSQFILLLHENPSDFSDVSPDEIQAIIGRYSAWREKIAAEGHFVDGHKLADEGGRSLTRTEAQLRVVDGPYSEAKEVLGGLFVIEARDYDHAVEISSGCPHLEYGGRIELREIDQMHDDD
ncbi:MAG: YciI family protein [Deltaproteobacteria bacterium]|nr:YciI family protein [Deltaproteobacteria bacterium]